MSNTISLNNSSMYDLYKIGNVGTYASNLVKNNMNKDGTLKKTGSSNPLSSYLNSFTNTTNNTLKNNSVFTKENTSNLGMLKSMASSLSSAAKTLGASTLMSSDNSVVTAKASLYGSSDMSFKIGVSNLATSQQSKSTALGSFENSAFGLGKNSFRLDTEKGSFDINFDVAAGDTTEDTLNDIASQINESKADVTAKVVSQDGKSSLQITSNETGQLGGFEVSGTTGNSAASVLGMEATTQAQDARYSINGQNFTSATNTVSVPDGRGAKMTLQGEGTATLSKATDASGLVAAAQNFASAYNQTVSHLMSGSADGAGVTRALNLVADNRMTQMSMQNYGGHAASRLSAMGIGIDEDGNMQIDAEKLTKAVQDSPNAVRDALAGYGGVASTAITNADQAMRIPAATYTNFGNMQVQDSLINALMPKSGFLFDIGL